MRVVASRRRLLVLGDPTASGPGEKGREREDELGMSTIP